MNKPVFYTYDQYNGSINESKFLDSISKFKNTISKYSNFLSTLGEDYEKLSKEEFAKKYSFGSRTLSGDIVDKFEENILDKAEKLVAESLELNEAFSIFKQGNKLRKAMLGFYIFLQLIGLSVNSNAATIDEQLEKAAKTETVVKEIKEDDEALKRTFKNFIKKDSIETHSKGWIKEGEFNGGKIIKLSKKEKFKDHGWTILKRGGELDYKGPKVDIEDTNEGKDSQEMEKRFQWINDRVIKLSKDSTTTLDKSLEKMSDDFKKRFKDSEVEIKESSPGIFDIFYSYKFKDSDNYASADYKTSTGKTIKKGEKIPTGTIVTHLNVGELKREDQKEVVKYLLHVSTDERYNVRTIKNVKTKDWFKYLEKNKIFNADALIDKISNYYTVEIDNNENKESSLNSTIQKYKDSVKEANEFMKSKTGYVNSNAFGVDKDVIETLKKVF